MSDLRCGSCGGELRGGMKFCPSCGSATSAGPEAGLPSGSRAVRHPMSRRAKTGYAFGALGLGALFLAVFANHLPGGADPVIAAQPSIEMASMFTDVHLTASPISVEVRGNKIVFPLALLLEKKYVSFEYTAATHPVPLLAYISPEGKLVTSIRLCEPCNSETFNIEGTEFVCGVCGTRWKLNNLEGLSGACQKYPPAPIPSAVEGNMVTIDIGTVTNWKMRI